MTSDHRSTGASQTRFSRNGCKYTNSWYIHAITRKDVKVLRVAGRSLEKSTDVLDSFTR